MVQTRVLVAGIGNIFLGDDAFGCEVVKRLTEHTWPDNIRVVDFGIRGFDLVYALLDGYEAVILIDATPRGGEPGTLYTIEPDFELLDSTGEQRLIETHGMNPIKVLSLVKSMGGQFRRILLVGCEPETFGPEEGQMGLSRPVAAAVDQAVNVVEDLVAKVVNDLQINALAEADSGNVN